MTNVIVKAHDSLRLESIWRFGRGRICLCLGVRPILALAAIESYRNLVSGHRFGFDRQ